MKKKYLTLAVIAAGFAIIGSAFYWVSNRPTSDVVSYSSKAFDTSDKAKLVNWADNVFVGTVVKKEGEAIDPRIDWPYSIYTIKVEKNLKGNLSESIRVSQNVGYHPQEKRMYRMDNDVYLKAGNKYLFVTSYEEATKTHHVVEIEGDVLLDSSKREANVVNEFVAAVANQRPWNE